MGVIQHYDRINDSAKGTNEVTGVRSNTDSPLEVCRVYKEIQIQVVPHEMKDIEGCQHEVSVLCDNMFAVSCTEKLIQECGQRRNIAQNVLKRSAALARKHSCS